MPYKVVLTFQPVYGTLVGEHSMKTYWAVLSCDTAYNAVQVYYETSMCNRVYFSTPFFFLFTSQVLSSIPENTLLFWQRLLQMQNWLLCGCLKGFVELNHVDILMNE